MIHTKNIAILGASAKTDRYAYIAFQLLKSHGYNVFPVNPGIEQIDGHLVYPDLKAIPEPIDTLTVYLNPNRLRDALPTIIAMHPRRIIFNPGTESDELEAQFTAENILCIHGCTIVMLKTNQF